MPTITLKHCIATVIYCGPPEEPPQQITITVTVGGSAGDGAVNVVGGAPPSVVTGTSAPVSVPGANQVVLHYVAPPDKPQSVDVDYVLLVL